MFVERDFFIDNLLVRIHFNIVMIRWTGLAPWECEFPFPGSLTCSQVPADVRAREPRLRRASGNDSHGGLRPFHQKSTCIHSINFRASCGANLVTYHADSQVPAGVRAREPRRRRLHP